MLLVAQYTLNKHTQVLYNGCSSEAVSRGFGKQTKRNWTHLLATTLLYSMRRHFEREGEQLLFPTSVRSFTRHVIYWNVLIVVRAFVKTCQTWSWTFQPFFFLFFLLSSYYVNGRDTSLEDFLDPQVLNTLALKTKEVLEVTVTLILLLHRIRFKTWTWLVTFIFLQTVDLVSPGKKVWLGETSSAYGGGAVGLSDTFVAGFMWVYSVIVDACGFVSLQRWGYSFSVNGRCFWALAAVDQI